MTVQLSPLNARYFRICCALLFILILSSFFIYFFVYPEACLTFFLYIQLPTIDQL